jgi:hypothetical protein
MGALCQTLGYTYRKLLMCCNLEHGLMGRQRIYTGVTLAHVRFKPITVKKTQTKFYSTYGTGYPLYRVPVYGSWHEMPGRMQAVYAIKV